MTQNKAAEPGMTRIQKAKRETILEAALTVFSQGGFRGSTLDAIAKEAGLSKPNLLYYYPSKEAIHQELLHGLLHTWLDPLTALDPDGDPVEEILAYVRRKLELAKDYPRESRLFANEILQGAPRMHAALTDELRPLVEDRAAVIQSWVDTGKIAPVEPTHLIFSIWAQTQHYADFDVQVRAILGPVDPFIGASAHLEQMFQRMLRLN